ncbi:hypothetical protein [Emticicia fontis]
MNPNLYQPSGKISPLFYPIGALFLCIVPVLSNVYSQLHWSLPFIFLHFFFTIGYGIALGWILNQALKFGKVRNKKFASYFALITGLVAIYFIWTSYIDLLFKEDSVMRSFYKENHSSFTVSPSVIWETMSYLYKNGSWNIESYVVKGFLLALIWFLEAFIIVGMTMMTGTTQVEEPFSEQTNTWFEKTKLTSRIRRPVNLEAFLAALGNGQTSVLGSLSYFEFEEESADYYQITIFTHEEETMSYINFSYVVIKTDRKGRESTDVTDLIKNVKVSKADLHSIEYV